ncbi:R3H domain-containing nucleic acid-binding protein [Micrococcus sp. FDAARGOS_333]|uniref:Jag family protein n=1 Tax=Micrococcus sp. FDAARGOS_333 TaxID=1930558 RepID=UPI000B4E4D4B|nr:R3H domain-containing nucleic acid-binding protein [Micrococcus sp. FDAARGOS_333]PNL17051.1 RNA-binding protein [Micrococcus sp. FDAARGOS_333]
MSEQNTPDVQNVEQQGEQADVAVEQTSEQADAAVEQTSEQADARPRATAAERLEEEGDVAADYVEELLDIADLDGDIDIEVRDGRTYVSVIADEGDEALQDLVGRNGKTLESLQELVRLAVLASTGHRSRLILDVAGYRTRRGAELRTIADRAVAEVKDGKGPVHLEPMGAYERKIVHDVVADAGLVSESEGEGPHRHVVISADD